MPFTDSIGLELNSTITSDKKDDKTSEQELRQRATQELGQKVAAVANLPALNLSNGSNKAVLSNFNIQSAQDDANIDSTKENSIQGS